MNKTTKIEKTGLCFCGCGEEPRGGYFVIGHDHRTQGFLVEAVYGSTAAMALKYASLIPKGGVPSAKAKAEAKKAAHAAKKKAAFEAGKEAAKKVVVLETTKPAQPALPAKKKVAAKKTIAKKKKAR